MIELPLDSGLVALISPSNLRKVAPYRWRAVKGLGNTHYAATRIDGRMVLMHRLIKDAREDQIVDHRDLNGLNNTWGNLRFCTVQQNNVNKGLSVANTSGYKGVSVAGDGLWAASITRNGTRRFLGTYDDPVMAARVYNFAALFADHSFARLNVLPEDSGFDYESPVLKLSYKESVFLTLAVERGVQFWDAVKQAKIAHGHVGQTMKRIKAKLLAVLSDPERLRRCEADRDSDYDLNRLWDEYTKPRV
jgi:hypothetical protein